MVLKPAPRTSQTSKIINAPRMAVYNACLDPDLLVRWRAPDNMKAEVHAFDAREGGAYRMSLSYLDPANSQTGKSSESTDTFAGRFVELVRGEKIVEVVAFDSPDPKFAGEMTVTTRLVDRGERTEINLLFEDIPPGIRPEDNEAGTRQALEKLAALFGR